MINNTLGLAALEDVLLDKHAITSNKQVFFRRKDLKLKKEVQIFQ